MFNVVLQHHPRGKQVEGGEKNLNLSLLFHCLSMNCFYRDNCLLSIELFLFLYTSPLPISFGGKFLLSLQLTGLECDMNRWWSIERKRQKDLDGKRLRETTIESG